MTDLTGITTRLRSWMLGPRLEIGDELFEIVADRSRFEHRRRGSTSTGAWHIRFLKWALKDRCRDFVRYAEAPSRAGGDRGPQRNSAHLR